MSLINQTTQKFQLKEFYAKVLNIYYNLETENKAKFLSIVCEKSGHSNLASFHNDKSFDLLEKVRRYQTAIDFAIGVEKPTLSANALLQAKHDSEQNVEDKAVLDDLINQVAAIWNVLIQDEKQQDVYKQHIESITKNTKHSGIGLNNYKSFMLDPTISLGNKIARLSGVISNYKSNTHLIAQVEEKNAALKKLSDDVVLLQKDCKLAEIKHFEQTNDLIKQLQTEKNNINKVKELVIRHISDSQELANIVFDKTKEKFHKQFIEILTVLSTRNIFGWTEFLYIYGAAGAGKTFMSHQLARALNVTAYIYPGATDVTTSKVMGFNNFATGSFIEGWAYKPFKEGGLFVVDEGDLMDAAVLASGNSMDNTEYRFGNGELVKRHKDFYFIVWANTDGTGSKHGYQRNKLDAATLDRFTLIELKYDEELERELYVTASAWVQYVQRVREYAEKKMNNSFLVTPRAIRKGEALLRAGVNPERVAEIALWRQLPKNNRETIMAEIGKFTNQ